MDRQVADLRYRTGLAVTLLDEEKNKYDLIFLLHENRAL